MSEERKLTTVEDLLGGYKEKDLELSTGKVFTIQSFAPGNLMIDIGSPLVQMLIEASEEDLRRTTLDMPMTNAGRAWTRIEQLVCDNVTSVRFSPEPQNYLPTGLVSLRRLSLVEIQELYVGIQELSISPEELENFRKVHRESEDESEQSELASEDSEDSGEE